MLTLGVYVEQWVRAVMAEDKAYPTIMVIVSSTLVDGVLRHALPSGRQWLLVAPRNISVFLARCCGH